MSTERNRISPKHKHQHNQDNQAMQRYLRYLKSNRNALAEEQQLIHQLPLNAWKKQLLYEPPGED